LTDNITLVSSVTILLIISRMYSFLLLKADHRNMNVSDQKKVANIICNGENYFLINPLNDGVKFEIPNEKN